MSKATVVGGGNAGFAFAAYLGLNGHKVCIFETPEFENGLKGVAEEGGIKAFGIGGVNGFTEIDKLTTNVEEALEYSDLIFICAPAFAHEPLAKLFAPYLKKNHIVTLNPGNTFGALAFLNAIRSAGNKEELIVGEASSNVFSCRRIGSSEVRIKAVKHVMPFNAIPADRTKEAVDRINEFFPQFVVGDSPFEASIVNNNAILHPVSYILNTGRVEDNGEFDFYWDGMTPSVCKIMNALDQEKVAIGDALALGYKPTKTLLKSLHEFYGKEEWDTLYKFVSQSPFHGGNKAKFGNMGFRYITEDIPYGFVPMSELAKILGVPTPFIDSFILFANEMHGIDYRAIGRNMESLGLAGLNLEQIKQKLMYGEVLETSTI